MNNKLSLFALGIALVGVLIYVLSSGTPPDKSAVVPDTSDSSAAGSPPVTVGPPLSKQRALPGDPVNSVSNETVSSPATPPAKQQAPALEPEIREALGDMLNTSSEGLVEETRNGATSVDLQGRFQTAPVATVDENGNVQITDYSHLPKAATQP